MRPGNRKQADYALVRQLYLYRKMKAGSLVTASQLAAMFEVTKRTIYRDIAEMRASGLRILGDKGVGYMMRHHQ